MKDTESVLLSHQNRPGVVFRSTCKPYSMLLLYVKLKLDLAGARIEDAKLQSLNLACSLLSLGQDFQAISHMFRP
jgi:hypothetical protein